MGENPTLTPNLDLQGDEKLAAFCVRLLAGPFFNGESEMPIYKVHVRKYQTVIQDAEIFVEARGKILAQKEAERIASQPGFPWKEEQKGFDERIEVISSLKEEREHD